jgi:hypothetical protein
MCISKQFAVLVFSPSNFSYAENCNFSGTNTAGGGVDFADEPWLDVVNAMTRCKTVPPLPFDALITLLFEPFPGVVVTVCCSDGAA